MQNVKSKCKYEKLYPKDVSDKIINKEKINLRSCNQIIQEAVIFLWFEGKKTGAKRPSHYLN